MKKKKWYVAMATALLLAAGCSDDLGNGKNNTGAEEDGEKVYMTVNVSTVSQGTLTKADTTPSNPNQGGRRHEEIPHFRKSKKIPLFAQRTGKMQIYNKYSADRGKCRDSSAGRHGGSFLLRYGDRVAAPSVCRAVACILLAAAPTAPPCFRRWRSGCLCCFSSAPWAGP